MIRGVSYHCERPDEPLPSDVAKAAAADAPNTLHD
jgi:hypothetical protein